MKLFNLFSKKKLDKQDEQKEPIIFTVNIESASVLASISETISYHGGSVELFYEQMSRDLIKKHGSLKGVDYLSHYPKFEIYFFYEDGTRIYSGQRTGSYDIHFLTLGYIGEGPRYAQHFLSAAGFELSMDQIASIEPDDSIQIKAGKTVILKKKDKVNEKEMGTVKYSHEQNKIVNGFPAYYRYYTAPDKKTALSFLEKQEITAQSYFVVVETPEGIIAKDRMGVFEP